CCFFFQAEDGIRDFHVTGVQTCALPILVMLAEQGLVDPGSARKILAALESIDLAQVAASRYDGRYEDLFFYVEDLTLQAAGEERSEERRVGKEGCDGRKRNQ